MNIKERFRNFMQYGTWQAKTAVFGGLGIFLLIIVVAIAALLIPKITNTYLVAIDNYDETINIPEGYYDVVQKNIQNIFVQNGAMDIPTYQDASVREGSYKEKRSDNIVVSDFIIDIESMQYSFKVKVVWVAGESAILNDPDVTITCPDYTEVIYTEKKCIAETPIQQIKKYLPHTLEIEGGLEPTFWIDLKKKMNSFYVSVAIRTCGDKQLEEKAVKETKKWIKSRFLDPNDYEIKTTDVCWR